MNNEYMKEILNNITGIYQEDGYYLILYKNDKLCYIDLDNFNIDIDKITSKRKEKYYLNKIINALIDDIQNNYLYNDFLEDKEI